MPYVRLFFMQLIFWIFAAFISLVSPANAQTASNGTDNAIFYEVSGNGLKHPSYLFGTFHLLTKTYVDGLPGVMDKFNTCGTMAGEMIIDSTVSMKMLSVTMLKGTTLDKVLDKKTYKKTAAWMKELGGYDLALFNGMSPMVINLTLLQLIQAKYFPNPPGDIPMDTYFQQAARKQGMKLVGLEPIEDQMNALFSQFPVERQAKMLADFVKKKDESIEEMKKMIADYKAQKLEELGKLMYKSESYESEEKTVMLTKRNAKWMEQLPVLMNENPTFVAVGALHLAGDDGLVHQLRMLGYTVNPITI